MKKHIAYRRTKDIQPEAIANTFDKQTSEIMEAEIQNLDVLEDICEHKHKSYIKQSCTNEGKINYNKAYCTMVYHRNNCTEKEGSKKGENLVQEWSRSSMACSKNRMF